jgi:hypothetical protein
MRRLTLLLLLVAFGAFAPAAHAAPCFPTLSVDDVRTATADAAHFEAHGKTVSSGKTIDDFDVTILGVLDDGVGIDHDMILAEVHDYPALNNPRVKGIWAGMSGSPVYTSDGKLIGAIAYGLSTGASPIAGITPADDMADVLERPTAPVTPAGARATAALQHEMVATGAVTARQAAGRFERLPIPLAISGLNSNRLQKVAARLPGSDRFIPYAAGGAAASAQPGDADEIKEPGSNFATALSYGDVAAAGVGTTTEHCGDSVIAFGHPMNFDGPTSLSVHNATAIVIQDDLIAPFKVANIGGIVGTLDQDRLSGIRALIGPVPTPVDVTSTVTSDGGAADPGETFVNRTNDSPDLAAAHLLGSVDNAIDRIGGGRMTLGWTVVGTAGGQPFSFTRNNKFADQADISFASVDEMFNMLATLVFNPFSDVKFTDVKMTANIQSDFRQYTITGLQRFDGSTWVPVKDGDTITAQAGTSLQVRVLLENFRSSAPVAPVELTFPIAADASGDGSLDITAGADSGGEDPSSSGGSQPTTFKEMLDQLAEAPQNNDLTGKLSIFGSGGGNSGGGESPPTATAAFADTTSPPPVTISKELTEVVGGGLSIPITVSEPQPSPSPKLNLSGKSSLKMATALRKGMRLTVRSSVPGRLVLKAYVDKKTARRLHIKRHAKGPVVVAALTKHIGDGRSTVTLKLARKVKPHLRHAKRVKVALKATITDVDGNRKTDRSKLVLTRN